MRRLLLLPVGLAVFLLWWTTNPPFLNSRPPVPYSDNTSRYMPVLEWLQYATAPTPTGAAFRHYLTHAHPALFLEYAAVFVFALLFASLFINLKKSGIQDTLVHGGRVVRGRLRVRWTLFKLGNPVVRRLMHPFRKLPAYDGVHLTYYQKLPKDAERYHSLLLGSTGSGKTQTISRLLKDITHRQEANKAATGGYQNDKVIILDTKGDYTESFANPDNAILISPGDARNPTWCLGADIPSTLDIDPLLVALVEDAKDAFFSDNARNVLRCVITELRLTKRAFTLEDLLEGLKTENIYRSVNAYDSTGVVKGSLFKPNGTPANDSEMSRGILSVVQTLVPKIAVMRGNSGLLFSIQSFLTNPKYSRLIIKRHASQADSFALVARLLFGVLSIHVSRMPDSNTRRIWLLLDELAVLGKFPPLVEFLERGRSKGLCVVGALQDWGSMEEAYKETARSLFSNFNSKVYLSQKEPKTAEYLERTLGEKVLERRSVTTNKNSALSLSPAISEQTSIAKEPVVTAADLLRMPQASRDGVFMYTAIAGYTDIFYYRAPILPFSEFMPKKFPGFIPAGGEEGETPPQAPPVPPPDEAPDSATPGDNNLDVTKPITLKLPLLPGVVAATAPILEEPFVDEEEVPQTKHDSERLQAATEEERLAEYYTLPLSDRFHPPENSAIHGLIEVAKFVAEEAVLPEALHTLATVHDIETLSKGEGDHTAHPHKPHVPHI